MRVIAPLPQAQLVETRIINFAHFQTLVASKAARMVLAAPGKQLVDFGLRRAHGAEAGLLAARASYLAGYAETATTLAAPRFDHRRRNFRPRCGLRVVFPGHSRRGLRERRGNS